MEVEGAFQVGISGYFCENSSWITWQLQEVFVKIHWEFHRCSRIMPWDFWSSMRRQHDWERPKKMQQDFQRVHKIFYEEPLQKSHTDCSEILQEFFESVVRILRACMAEFSVGVTIALALSSTYARTSASESRRVPRKMTPVYLYFFVSLKKFLSVKTIQFVGNILKGLKAIDRDLWNDDTRKWESWATWERKESSILWRMFVAQHISHMAWCPGQEHWSRDQKFPVLVPALPLTHCITLDQFLCLFPLL